MTPTSTPKIPSQPSTAEYDAKSLQTLVSFSIQSFFALFGVAAPKFDPTRPIQAWFDTTPQSPFSPYNFTTISTDANGAPLEIPYTIPGIWALTVNLPAQSDTVPGTTPILPVPVRTLLANETLFMNEVGPGIFAPWILRTDLQSNLPAVYTQSDKAIVARAALFLAKNGF